MTAAIVNGVLTPQHQKPVFDAIAEDYDRIFTHSILGNAQRSLIHEYLRCHLHKGQRILDLNCGTGEDAIYLASLGNVGSRVRYLGAHDRDCTAEDCKQ